MHCIKLQTWRVFRNNKTMYILNVCFFLSSFLFLNTCFLFHTRITHTHGWSCYFLGPRFVISVHCDSSWLIISFGVWKCHASVICAARDFFIISDDANRLIVMQPTEIDSQILYVYISIAIQFTIRRHYDMYI